jgi:hypothetical protein
VGQGIVSNLKAKDEKAKEKEKKDDPSKLTPEEIAELNKK